MVLRTHVSAINGGVPDGGEEEEDVVVVVTDGTDVHPGSRGKRRRDEEGEEGLGGKKAK